MKKLTLNECALISGGIGEDESTAYTLNNNESDNPVTDALESLVLNENVEQQTLSNVDNFSE